MQRILDLGTGTGATARSVLDAHRGAELVGIDESAAMRTRARSVLPADADLRVARLEDPLPDGPVRPGRLRAGHPSPGGGGKADLFRRIADGLDPAGRLVLGDLIVLKDPADVVTSIDGEYRPSSVVDHLKRLNVAGFEARVTWIERDLAVFAAELRRGTDVLRRRRRPR